MRVCVCVWIHVFVYIGACTRVYRYVYLSAVGCLLNNGFTPLYTYALSYYRSMCK